MIRSDTWRLCERDDFRSIVRTALLRPAGRFMINHRIGQWARSGGNHRWIRIVTGLLHRRWSVRYSLDIPFVVSIGPGLKILHIAGGIVVNSSAVIGADCTLSHGVTLGGKGYRGEILCPTLGNGVRVMPGAKVIGRVRVGDHVDIGANAVVTHDIPANSVAAGVPARIIEGRSPPPIHFPSSSLRA